ncbi:MAG: HAMP domain-containing sensor histidine kinase [Candidatus Palauibacterales bacterium]|nr:HAMP domain-containing sensor histidine kinase [Candidatus Palauibacterales bacterium]
MADNVPSRSSQPESAAGASAGRGSRGAEWAGTETLVRSLPERFRTSGARLARELFGSPRDVRVVELEDEPDDALPWYAGLELEEAWAVAQAFRRAIGEAVAAPGSEDGADPDELHAGLDRELLQLAIATLHRTSDAHRRMVQDVSHDLRSPLNSILFLADALRTERSGPLTAAQGHQLNVLYTAAVTLVRMANDLIDFSRLGVGREHIIVSAASFSLETVIAEVRSLVGPLSTHRGAELRTVFEAEGLRHGDQRLLGRVLLNLVSNALEAVEAGGTVTLAFSDTEAGDLAIEVGDDRTGTDVEALRQLLAITDDRWPGETRGWTRGLGLTISARFVQAAGGRIEVLDRSGKGTVFRVELPFRRL